MFTGLIEDVGIVESVKRTSSGHTLQIRSGFSDLTDGESIAVNGACLTVLEKSDEHFTVAAIVTTLERTAIAEWSAGKRVNLERAMRADGRFGGHIVQGHVDAVGLVVAVQKAEDALLVDIDIPESLTDWLVPHGSVALDGVSLTVNAITASRLQVSLIEYTLKHSALGDLVPGSRVHVETDVIGKYVRRLAAPYFNSRPADWSDEKE
jgi:riboflavin synthase, alpha subunit